MSYDAGDIVVVPFPFTDRGASKRRPALVLSSYSAFNLPSGHAVLAMITSEKNSPWPLDVILQDLDAAGLPSPSRVRMKLFTLDQRLIIRKTGCLAEADQIKVTDAIASLLHAGTRPANSAIMRR
ncbi:MAG: type II toxin-antitoxin system PemK/MazF family toxin [Gammaproteobacteria bacterium]|nr:type II toxin-antitoxin system PemK/MazF family toxin [Gammaproteobacteria bacterium]